MANDTTHRQRTARLLSAWMWIAVVSLSVANSTTALAAPWQQAGRVELLPVPGPVAPDRQGILDQQAIKDQRGIVDPQGTMARLRIPSELILEALESDFTHQTPVQRTVLGTASQGHAVCYGHVDGEFLTAEGSAKLSIRVAGTLTSQTRGVNGPAIIDSHAHTQYQATSIITFDGDAFVAQPSQVCGKTRLTITNIDSKLPRLRGRIVRRVAARRAQESHSQAQDITCQITLNDIQKHIDKELQQRLTQLNQRFAERLSVLKLFKENDADLIISTHPDLIQLDLVSTTPTVGLPAIPQLVSIGTAVELWLPVPPLAETPLGVIALSTLPEMLGSMLDDRPKLAELLTDQLHFDRHGSWLIVQLENGE